ncbi:MAG: NAD(P)/FAD-dependent oxidoreductase [Methanomassiliicoccales archaeon]|nr:NAD(P)/FAD-dependent oxidoreductase [Methanomassiliicoccales archaeon]
MMMPRDLIVVGGGPIGSRVAEGTAKECDTVILEEHSFPGKPVQCAGLVTPRVVGAADAERAVLNELRGALIHFPGGEDLEIMAEETKAVVIDRAEFDVICHERALKNGAEFLSNHRFRQLQSSANGMALKVDSPNGEKIFHTRLVVGADGWKSNVGKKAGLKGPREMIKGIQVDLDHQVEDQDRVEVFLGSGWAPGFFAWSIPCGDFTRVGLCVSSGNSAPSSFLDKLLGRMKLDDATRLRTMGGAIPLGTVPRSYTDRVMLVGDAAAQAKPLSGGGLYTGMVAADYAASTAIESLDEDDLSKKSLSRYEIGWKGALGRELERGYRLRKVFLRMNDKKLDEVGKILKKPEVEELLSSGDIDQPSLLAPKVLRLVPSLVRFSPQILGSFLSR